MREAEIAVVVGRAPRRLAGGACSGSSRARCRATARCRPTGPTSGPRARCSRSPPRRSPARSTPPRAAGRSWCSPTSPGFDGSPESMRRLQLEYGAEIGRAVVNFDGPIVFCVISRFHGGAFVVFSRALNEQLETIALEGAHASVIGGAPAAAVVFAREVDHARASDPRIAGARRADRARRRRRAPAAARRARRAVGRGALREARRVRGASSTPIHSIERAVEVGSVERIVAAARAAPVPDRRRRARHAATLDAAGRIRRQRRRGQRRRPRRPSRAGRARAARRRAARAAG